MPHDRLAICIFTTKQQTTIPSFLRRQEFRETGIKLLVWIPAFAGMTVHYFLAKALDLFPNPHWTE
jgi:hypothetical protein